MLKKIAFASVGVLLLASPLIASAQTEDDYGTGADSGGYCPELSTTFRRGATDASTNGQVSELQRFLTDYYDINQNIIVGVFGRITHGYVLRFQREQGLPAFGIVGSMTRAAIADVCGGSGDDETTTTNTDTITTTSALPLNAHDQVQLLYVGYLGRPADTAGMTYYSGLLNAHTKTLAQVAQEIGMSAEAKAKYTYLASPNASGVNAFLDIVYQTLFNRAPDSVGRTHWTSELTARTGDAARIAQIILDIASGAQGSDVITMNGKITAANAVTPDTDPPATPAAPTNLTATCNGGTSATLTWTRGTGAVYSFPRASSTVQTSQSTCPPGYSWATPTTCYQDNVTTSSVTYPVQAGVTYRWWVHNSAALPTSGWTNVSAATIGSTSFTCQATNAVNGTCGSANGTTVSSAPSTNLCTTGTAGSVTGSGPWTWSCAGSNGGTNASCSASQTGTVSTPTQPTMSPVVCSTNGTSVTLSWGTVSVSGVSSSNIKYPVRYSGSGLTCPTTSGWWSANPGECDFDTNTATSVTVPVTPGVTYQWWVHTANATNANQWAWSPSTPVSFTCSASATSQSCTAPWGATVANGASVTAYSTSFVAVGSTCVSEQRTCTNGSLSGGYYYQNCSPGTVSASVGTDYGAVTFSSPPSGATYVKGSDTIPVRFSQGFGAVQFENVATGVISSGAGLFSGTDNQMNIPFDLAPGNYRLVMHNERYDGASNAFTVAPTGNNPLWVKPGSELNACRFFAGVDKYDVVTTRNASCTGARCVSPKFIIMWSASSGMYEDRPDYLPADGVIKQISCSATGAEPAASAAAVAVSITVTAPSGGESYAKWADQVLVRYSVQNSSAPSWLVQFENTSDNQRYDIDSGSANAQVGVDNRMSIPSTLPTGSYRIVVRDGSAGTIFGKSAAFTVTNAAGKLLWVKPGHEAAVCTIAAGSSAYTNVTTRNASCTGARCVSPKFYWAAGGTLISEDRPDLLPADGIVKQIQCTSAQAASGTGTNEQMLSQIASALAAITAILNSLK